jgi:ParB/RepB/Spo0J family partition protein
MTTTATPALELTHIPLKQLAPHHDNVRKNLGDLGELTKSIAGSGILEPLLVLPADTEGVHLIVAGHRRFAGAQKAKLTEAPCVVRDLTPVEVLEAMLVENLQRADITPIEEARAYARLVELDTTVAAIAKKVGRSQALVKSRLALVQLPDEILDAVEAGAVSLESASSLGRYADDDVAMAFIAKRVKAGSCPAPWTIDEHVSKTRKEKAVAAETAKVKAAGLAMFKKPNSWWMPPYGLQNLTSPHTVALLHLKGGAPAHQAEPCHAVLVQAERKADGTYAGTRIHICTNPQRHTDKGADGDRSDLQIPKDYLPGKTTGTGAGAKESKAEKEARLATEAATTARTEFALALIAKLCPLPIDDFLAGTMLDRLADLRGGQGVAGVWDWVHPGIAVPDDSNAFELAQQLIAGDRLGPRDVSDRWILAEAVDHGEDLLRRGGSVWNNEQHHGPNYLRWLISHGYEPTDVDNKILADDDELLAQEAAEAAAGAIPDVAAMELSDEAFDAIVEIHEAVDADPSMGHPGEGIDDTLLEDLKQRGLVDVEFTEAGPAITFTDLGSAVATEVVKQATEIVAPE